MLNTRRRRPQPLGGCVHGSVHAPLSGATRKKTLGVGCLCTQEESFYVRHGAMQPEEDVHRPGFLFILK